MDVLSLLLWYLRPLIKWFLRKTTRLCELQRLCYGEQAGAGRTLAVQQSLESSRNKEIKKIMETVNTSSDLNSDENIKKFIDESIGKIMKVWVLIEYSEDFKGMLHCFWKSDIF